MCSVGHRVLRRKRHGTPRIRTGNEHAGSRTAEPAGRCLPGRTAAPIPFAARVGCTGGRNELSDGCAIGAGWSLLFARHHRRHAGDPGLPVMADYPGWPGQAGAWQERVVSVQGRTRLMPQLTIATLVKLLIASLVVGMIMAFLGITPRDVLGYVTSFANEAIENAAAWAGSAISYVLLGAVIVIPIWLLSMLFKTFNRR